MRIEDVAIRPRARSGWQAIDLGFRMAAHWWRPLWLTWLALFVPLGAAVVLTLREHPFFAALALWWLLPVFDRFLLHVLARAVFGDVPALASTLSAWRQAFDPTLLLHLLLRPFAYRRSFFVPVTQLERQRGRAAAQRVRVLGRRLQGHVLALAFVCALFEIVVIMGADTMVELLAPVTDTIDDTAADAPWAPPDRWTLRITLLFALAVTLIEPFYVAAGFALYLGRRVQLEGWDIELGLRRLARGASQATAPALLLLALALAALPVAPAGAGPICKDPGCDTDIDVEAMHDPTLDCTPDGEASGDDACIATFQDERIEQHPPDGILDTPARSAIVDILDDRAFGGMVEEEVWKRRDTSRERRSSDARFESIGRAIATVMKAMAWIALGVLAIALLAMVLKRWQRGEPTTRAHAPQVLFGLAIAPDSLPDDVPGAARAALDRGDVRNALSLLYRGLLSDLVHGRGLRVTDGATEGDVLRLAQRKAPRAIAEYLGRLLPMWIALAYAGRTPDGDAVRALCDGYPVSATPPPDAATVPA